MDTRPMMVAQLRSAKNPDYYGLTLVDPYRGAQQTVFHHAEDILSVCARLDFSAEVRNLNFEVHDLSGSQMVLLKPVTHTKRTRR